MMNLAVMSDLHVGLKARSKDLCPEPPVSFRKKSLKYRAKTENDYKQKFIQFVQRENIKADYLVLPGDLTDSAHPEEVKLASEFILHVADALCVPQNKILFAPGNHDLDWSVFDLSDSTGLRRQQRYDPMRFQDFHFKKLIDLGIGDVFLPPHFTAWAFSDLFAIAYNSASHDDPNGKHHIHHGFADPAHLDAMQIHLDKVGPPDGRIRLFIVHHHPIDFTNPMPSIPDFSLMTNAEGLLSLLHKHEFDMIIHGHKHHPRFDTHSTQTYSHLPILCSGSFSVEIDTEWAGTIDNQFHLITINGRFGRERGIKGIIKSWTNNHCRGWIQSTEMTGGIHHTIPFGSYVMPHELDAQLEPFIRHWLQEHDYILWRQIVDAFPDYEHLPISSAIDAFRRMGQRLNKQVMYETLKDLILY